ncbi:MAG: hypothetical protein QOE45_2040 [Frankiaceae bacterium]|jgi:hypothetical protein|nr:hypothetical protein [Frankiaceae bacterium]
MERGTKHGARLDDAMAGETEAITRGAPVEPRVEEWREAEPAGEDQPVPDALIAGDPYPPNGLPHDLVELRSELAKRLRPSVFPATRKALLHVAAEEQAPGWVLTLLRELPGEGTTFENVQQVWEALGGPVEERA